MTAIITDISSKRPTISEAVASVAYSDVADKRILTRITLLQTMIDDGVPFDTPEFAFVFPKGYNPEQNALDNLPMLRVEAARRGLAS